MQRVGFDASGNLTAGAFTLDQAIDVADAKSITVTIMFPSVDMGAATAIQLLSRTRAVNDEVWYVPTGEYVAADAEEESRRSSTVTSRSSRASGSRSGSASARRGRPSRSSRPSTS
jgi:hypothetical protein